MNDTSSLALLLKEKGTCIFKTLPLLQERVGVRYFGVNPRDLRETTEAK